MAICFNTPENFDVDDLSQRALLIGSYARYQVRHNRHLILSMVGKPGSGKTYGAIDFAIKWQKIINKKEWKVEDSLALDASTFYKLVDKAQPGDVIIFDEIGAMTGMNSRKAMSSENVALSSLFQTIRSRNLIIILTTPNFGYIDKSLRELIDFNLTAEKLDYDLNLCKFKIQQLQVNEIKAKIYYHFPRAFVKNKGKFMMPYIYSELPPKEQTEMYEKMKFEYQDKLNKIIQLQLKRMQEKETGVVNLKPDEKKAFELYNEKLPLTEIYNKLGTTPARGSKILDVALAKMGVEKFSYAKSENSSKNNNIAKALEARGIYKKDFDDEFKKMKS